MISKRMLKTYKHLGTKSNAYSERNLYKTKHAWLLVTEHVIDNSLHTTEEIFNNEEVAFLSLNIGEHIQ